MRVRLSAVLSACLVAAAYSSAASATPVLKFYFNHAVSVCQPALPAFDGLIRKRPKALANEGTRTAFVSCAPGQQSDVPRSVEQVRVIVTNRQAGAVAVSCTLVDGISDATFNPSVVKTIQVPSGMRMTATWDYIADNQSTRYMLPAVSCALPPGTEISGLSYWGLDEVGS